jgi:hypothetical protein
MDGVNNAAEELTPELQAIYNELSCAKMDYVAEEHQNKALSEFFDKVIEEEVLI